MTKFKLPIHIKIFIALFICGAIFSGIKSGYTGFTSIYNQSVNYKLEYKSIEQNQVTSFDNDYLAFKEKFNIANVNKETFLNVTSIIMSARTDGQNLSWKWVHENQNIPYEEFTSFYKNLSSFTAERYAKNSAIETNKQTIAKNHNALLNTFPGVIYNYFLKIKPLEYKEGFISEYSKSMFNK